MALIRSLREEDPPDQGDQLYLRFTFITRSCVNVFDPDSIQFTFYVTVSTKWPQRDSERKEERD